MKKTGEGAEKNLERNGGGEPAKPGEGKSRKLVLHAETIQRLNVRTGLRAGNSETIGSLASTCDHTI
jgi:hypothetical protein